VALVAALGGIADYFIPLLIVLGIVSAPLAGVYVMDFFVLRGGRPYAIEAMNALPAFRGSAILAWGLGSAVGLTGTYWGHTLTRIPAADSILVAAIGHLLMNSSQWLRRRERAVRT
jgi:cytosine permease